MNPDAALALDDSSHLWARLRADGCLREAIEALHDATATLGTLRDDTAWESAGMRALHGQLEEHGHAAISELSRLRGVQEHCMRAGS